jgi:hypothetical protein
MRERRAKTRHQSVVECEAHKRKKLGRPRGAKPSNGCPVCWMIYLSDHLETPIYVSDVETLISFSNAFTKVIKPSSIEYNETAPSEEDETAAEE